MFVLDRGCLMNLVAKTVLTAPELLELRAMLQSRIGPETPRS